MKIAQIAPIWYSIPPKKYGGTEDVINHITEGLVKNGHDVTLFATGDSKTSAHLVSFFDKELVTDTLPQGREFFIYPYVHMIKSLEYIEKNKFDIVHCHYTTLADSILLGLVKNLKNCLFTIHSFFPEDTNPRWAVFKLFPKIPFVSISDRQRKGALNFVKTIYHGLNLKDYEFHDSSNINAENEYMFWISRVSPTKGLIDALKTSALTKKRLVFTATVNADADKKFYSEEVDPLLNNSLTVPIPELDMKKKNYYYQHARLFIFPIHWEEPFGLVLIESMACGTPVVAYARGSVPEIIKDGVTGFIVNESEENKRGDWIIKKTGIEGLREAVEKIYSMSKEEYGKMRKACRAEVEKRFTVERMVADYEALYKTFL